MDSLDQWFLRQMVICKLSEESWVDDAIVDRVEEITFCLEIFSAYEVFSSIVERGFVHENIETFYW